MKRLLLFSITVLFVFNSQAQLLTWDPPFPSESNASQTLVITMDANKGNQGLLNHTPTSDVYVHIGVITNLSANSSDWKHVLFTWATTPPAAQATYIGNNKWTFTISGSLRTYFSLAAGETIQKIAIIFRSGNGNKKQVNTDGSDMYIPVYTNALAIRFTIPPFQPTYIPIPEPINKVVGDNITLRALSNNHVTLKLYLNGNLIQTATNDTAITANPTLTTAGSQIVVAEASDGVNTKTDTLRFFVAAPVNIAPLPAGVREGINYDANNTSVTLVLNAPLKNRVAIIGEFAGSNWTEQTQYVMNKTPDAKYWWLRINNLTPGTEYAYQYLVDGILKIADPYTEKILDPSPFADVQITAATYPGLKPYPTGLTTGIVSILQTASPVYNWSTGSFSRPDKRGLVIYELLVRDFVAAHDWKTLRDTLNYLKNLGVNAIEIMPFNEFENNDSWGYNSDFYFAPDKYYGPKNTLKEFIDSCHKKGFAVIMDIVLNHSYGPSPLVQLYWDPANNRPAANNPWYNPVQPHAFGFGHDFNHASNDTKYFFNRTLEHWLQEYKIDGYRVDFSKGLTQTPSTNDAQFSAYDASRIAIINAYAATIRNITSDAYIILEHFADNTEEKELANNGMLIWSSVWTPYQEAAMGYIANSNFEGGIHTVRGYTHPHLVTYMESHDQERIMYKVLQSGNNINGSYNIRHLDTALRRMEMNAAFLLTIPGPKMIWQFGELGYDYSINTCENLTVDPNCRLARKPIRWDYLQNAKRKKVYDVYSQLNKLRFHTWYKDAFMSNSIDRSLGGGFKWIKVTTDTSNLLVVGNFDVNATSGTVTFQNAGVWYDYLNNTTITATGSAQTINLAPGEYHVYVNRNVNNLNTTPVVSVPWSGEALEAKVFPNPTVSKFIIEINLPQSSQTNIELYNALGQKLKTLHNGFLQKGSHQIDFNKNSLSATTGSYYLKIQTKTATKTLQVTFQ